MKTRFNYRQIFPVLLILALAQFACSLGSLSSIAAPFSGSKTTQLPAGATPDRGTPDQAIAMLKLAVQHYNAVGRTQALADFTHRVAPFFDRDLYVACIDSNLTQSANGGYPNLVGSPIEPLSRSAWDAATKNKIGSTNYAWLDPATGTTEPKTFYYEKVGSDVCGVGAYNP